MALVLTTLRRNMQLKNLRHYMHVDGRQKTVFTVLRGRLSLMYVMHLSTMTMLPPLAQSVPPLAQAAVSAQIPLSNGERCEST